MPTFPTPTSHHHLLPPSLVPANYVQIIPPSNGHQPNPDGQPTPSSQEIVNDEENLLNDWTVSSKESVKAC